MSLKNRVDLLVRLPKIGVENININIGKFYTSIAWLPNFFFEIKHCGHENKDLGVKIKIFFVTLYKTFK
jgi:hypothetical protein